MDSLLAVLHPLIVPYVVLDSGANIDQGHLDQAAVALCILLSLIHI